MTTYSITTDYRGMVAVARPTDFGDLTHFYAAEIVDATGQVFAVVLEPEDRQDGWDEQEEERFRDELRAWAADEVGPDSEFNGALPVSLVFDPGRDQIEEEVIRDEDDEDDDDDDGGRTMATTGICDVCGTTVERGGEPVRGDGWYSGHQYVWGDIGGGVHGPRLFRVRCPEHPYDMTAEDVEQERDEWGDAAANAMARDYDRPDLVRATGAAGWRRDEEEITL